MFLVVRRSDGVSRTTYGAGTVDRSFRVAAVPRAISLVCGLVAAGSLWLPWARSGTVDRDAFELVRSARSLDLATGWGAVLAAGVVLVPAFAVAAVLVRLVAADRWRGLAGPVMSAVAGGIVLGFAGVVHRSPLGPRAGAWLGALAGALAIIATVLAVYVTGRPTSR